MTRKEYASTASQVDSTNFSLNEEYYAAKVKDVGPPLSGKGPVLIHQYQKCIKNYLKQVDFAQLSPYRSEICECVNHRAQFQDKISQETDDDIERMVPSIFSGFNVGLVLTIDYSAFILASTSPGLELTGDLNSEGLKMIQDISAGFLPSGIFEDLKKLNLTWYDGGLICEIVDKRRQREKISHVHLKVKSSDIGPLTYEREQDFLLNRYPLLCLDPDLHVTDVARTIKADAERWIQPITHEVKEQGEDMEDTTPQPQKEPITTLLPPQESTEELRDKLVKYLLQSRENQM